MLQPGSQSPRLVLATEQGPSPVPGLFRPQALFFFKVECPTCPLAAPAVERLRQAYPALDVVAVSQDDEASTADWMRRYGLNARLSIEGDAYPASNAFELTTVPTLVLLEASGGIAAIQEGWSQDGYEALSTEAARIVGVPPVSIVPAGGPAFRPG